MNELTQQDNKTLSAQEIRAQVTLIQEVLKAVMKENVHYGIIPGCRKPTLYKPGAEKLASTFKLAIDPEISDLSTTDEIRYRIKAKITSMASGAFVGCGVGECSSSEEKYMWRKSVCDAEFNETPEDRRREKWIKVYDKEPFKVKQVRTSVADIANTILKMAKKRALIDAVLTCTAASDIFEQDLEDLPEDMRQEVKEPPAASKPEVNPPQAKPAESKGRVISEKQGNRLLAIATANGYSKDIVKEYVTATHKFEKLRHITVDKYDEIVKHFEDGND